MTKPSPAYPPTDIRFVSGSEVADLAPAPFRSAGLSHRFAVIQDTSVAGCVDMYFDERLWKAMVEIVLDLAGDSTVSFGSGFNFGDGPDQPPEAYWAAWKAEESDEREPAVSVTARRDGRIVAGMVTEFWTQAGGPLPYHDSYTYSVYADRDLGPEIMRRLAAANADGQWSIAGEVLPAVRDYGAKTPPWLRRALGWVIAGIVGLAIGWWLSSH